MRNFESSHLKVNDNDGNPIVEMALSQLSAKSIVVLDDERRASMVSNLLVVLCGERGAQPIVNTGTIYQ